MAHQQIKQEDTNSAAAKTTAREKVAQLLSEMPIKPQRLRTSADVIQLK